MEEEHLALEGKARQAAKRVDEPGRAAALRRHQQEGPRVVRGLRLAHIRVRPETRKTVRSRHSSYNTSPTRSTIVCVNNGSTGEWHLHGGKVEPGETEVAAVRRETLEEVDVAVADDDLWVLGGRTSHPLVRRPRVDWGCRVPHGGSVGRREPAHARTT